MLCLLCVLRLLSVLRVLCLLCVLCALIKGWSHHDPRPQPQAGCCGLTVPGPDTGRFHRRVLRTTQ